MDIYTVIGWSHFVKKSTGTKLVAIYCTLSRPNVEGMACATFVVSEDIWDDNIMIGSQVEFVFPFRSSFCKRIVIHE